MIFLLQDDDDIGDEEDDTDVDEEHSDSDISSGSDGGGQFIPHLFLTSSSSITSTLQAGCNEFNNF